ncbi:protein kinase [Bacillus salacetis]|uniref:Protein kinase n=1 Tax=Bacillus salacetis TaxID=2315464 RepID=A0A3A1R4V4_9BACI|nr:phosphotransferase [Bacillus salacetis]RIW37407.1 protein kinase [Bacillus salacetis]
MERIILSRLNELYCMNFTHMEAVTDEMFKCYSKQGIYFARMTNYKTCEEQQEEVAYTDFLYEQGFGTSKTVSSLNGNVIEKIILDKEVLAVLYKAAPVVHLPRKEWNAGVFKRLGAQIGKLHNLSRQFEKAYPIRYINDWHMNDEYSFFKYIPEEERSIRDIAEEAVSSVKNLPRNDSDYGLLHGDIWLGNVLMDSRSNMSFIDFQDCEKHFYLYDLAVPIYSALEYSYAGGGNIKDYGREITAAVIEGYMKEKEIPAEMLKHLPLFMKLKQLFEYSLMHMYLDPESLTEDQIRIMNLQRMRLEFNQPILA